MQNSGRNEVMVHHSERDLQAVFFALYMIFLPSAHEAGAEQRHKGDREDDSHGTGHALDQFNGHGVAVDDLDEGIAVNLEQQQHIQRRTRKSQDQGVCHGAHGIAADVHAGAEQLPGAFSPASWPPARLGTAAEH